MVELAPFDGELHRVDAGDALRLRKSGELAADARAPIHHGAENIKQARADVQDGEG